MNNFITQILLLILIVGVFYNISKLNSRINEINKNLKKLINHFNLENNPVLDNKTIENLKNILNTYGVNSAIKSYRKTTDCDLKEAVEFIKELKNL